MNYEKVLNYFHSLPDNDSHKEKVADLIIKRGYINKENISEINILDVRKNSEFMSEHVVDAENAPLDFINDSMLKVDKNKTYYVHCAGGYRSVIAASILKVRGFHNVIDVAGGYGAIKNTAIKRTATVCPSTLK